MSHTFSTAPFWRNDAPQYDSEAKTTPPMSADVVVVGAGYTGLSCARRLAQAGREVVALDAGRIGFGASSRNGGMIGWGHRGNLAALSRRYGASASIEILKEGQRSLDYTLGLIEAENIACDFQQTGRFLAAASPKRFEKLAKEADGLSRKVGLDIVVTSRAEQLNEIATEAYFGGLLMPSHGGLHPEKFHHGLLKAARHAGARVIGSMPVVGISQENSRWRINTPSGSILAGAVAFAANGYAGQFSRALRAFERRLIPLPSYIITTEPLGPNRVRALMPGGQMYVDTRSVHSYFRADPSGDRVIWGGRASLVEISPEAARSRLIEHMTSVFPELREVAVTHSWTGRIAYSHDAIPHVGRLDGVWYAGGYCGSGVAMAPYLGWRMAEKILGTPDGRTALDAASFDATPFYTRSAWFMRTVEAWHKALDWRDGATATTAQRRMR